MDFFRSPFGRGWVGARDGRVVRLGFGGAPPSGAGRGRLPFARAAERYFAGRAARLDARCANPGRTDFARRVYAEVRRIPAGRTRTYGDIAARAGRPGAARAVGQLMKRNPVGLLIP